MMETKEMASRTTEDTYQTLNIGTTTTENTQNGSTFELRNYQKECIETVNSLPDGSRTIAVLATGLGKTVVAANLDFHGRVLWLSHRDELVRQPEKYFIARGMSFGVEKAEEHENGEDVVSASIQSLSREGRLNWFQPDAFDTIILDEAQHAAADTYKKVLHYFKPRKLVGLTATPRRGDGQGLDGEFDNICFSRDLKWGIQNGYLSDIRCIRVKAGYGLAGIAMTAGDYTAKALSDAMAHSDNDAVTAKAYMDYARGKQTLIYCPTIERCESVLRVIRRMLPETERDTVAMLSGKDDPAYRRFVLDMYRKGRIHAIINCMILTEGTDLPATEVILNDRPTANDVLYEQIVGRGTRLYPGKKSCLVIDVVTSDWKDKKICTAPTLFGIDPVRIPESISRKLENGKMMLAENADELVEKQADGIADLARRISLEVETCCLLGDDFDAVIHTNAEDGYKTLAHEIRNRMKQDAREGLFIHRGYNDGYTRYIQPSYKGKIWLSDPDEYGKVTAEFDMERLHCVSEPVEEKQMMRMIRAYLDDATLEFMHPLWDNAARTEWENMKLSESQKDYIGTLYQDDNIKGQLSSLNKREAGDLINWKMDQKQISSAKKKAEKDKEYIRKKPESKAYRKWLEKRTAEDGYRGQRAMWTKDTWENVKKRMMYCLQKDAGRKEADCA